jgi:ornithine cyclodeaminase/alanine dehydrogenase-like protein (mu-crystallin family)
VTLLYLDAAEIGERLPPLAAVDALESALRAGLEPEREALRVGIDAGQGQLLVMPSAAGSHPIVKVLTVGGVPRIQGVCVAFDPKTLKPVAALDGIAVTNLRTSAVSALGVRHLVAPAAGRLLVFGQGPQSRAHVQAVCAVIPEIERVDVLGRDDPNRNELVQRADVICCCTTARVPLFDGSLVSDHATVVAMGTHEPDAREVDDALMARAGAVVVESKSSALTEAGDVVLALESHAIREKDLITLAALVNDKQKPDPLKPRVFKSTGMAWEDAVTVGAILNASTQ